MGIRLMVRPAASDELQRLRQVLGYQDDNSEEYRLLGSEDL
jgi:hypothetical protein